MNVTQFSTLLPTLSQRQGVDPDIKKLSEGISTLPDNAEYPSKW